MNATPEGPLPEARAIAILMIVLMIALPIALSSLYGAMNVAVAAYRHRKAVKAMVESTADREVTDTTNSQEDMHQQCTATLTDGWGYGQQCMLPYGHTGVHRLERSDGFVLMWGYER